MPQYYNNMAEWYWLAGDKSKAIDAQQKAVNSLKSTKDFSENEMAALEHCLEQYKRQQLEATDVFLDRCWFY